MKGYKKTILVLAVMSLPCLGWANGYVPGVYGDPPIAVGAGWSDTTATPPAFFFAGVGSSSVNYTYSSAVPTVISVTDAFDYGDVFAVYDFGALLGQTSPSAALTGSISDPNIAWTDPGYSHGAFTVGAGNHDITMVAVASPWGGGRGYIKVDVSTARVPDCGATGCLLGIASLMMGALGRKLRK
jgi:hypothetical protein